MEFRWLWRWISKSVSISTRSRPYLFGKRRAFLVDLELDCGPAKSTHQEESWRSLKFAQNRSDNGVLGLMEAGGSWAPFMVFMFLRIASPAR